MPLPLEDYALLGDTYTAALVGRDGSIDWLCLPRFDSDACFAALLGEPEHGRWLLAPFGGHRATARRYRGDSLVLETEFSTPDGSVRFIDCMPVGHGGRQSKRDAPAHVRPNPRRVSRATAEAPDRRSRVSHRKASQDDAGSGAGPGRRVRARSGSYCPPKQ